MEFRSLLPKLLPSLCVFVLSILFYTSSTCLAQPTGMVTGVCVHRATSHELEMIRAAGFTSIRDELPWRVVESQPGVLRVPAWWDDYIASAQRAGLDVLLILDYGNPLYDQGKKPYSPEGIQAFAKYAAFLATHFKGKVHRYEVWNEWDGYTGGTQPERADSYMRLLKAVYPKMKTVDPSLEIIAGATSASGTRSGWLLNAAREGLVQYSDAVSFHPYVFDRPESSAGAAIDLIRSTEQVLLQNSGVKRVSIYITELGWPTNVTLGGISPEAQAKVLSNFLIQVRSVGAVKGVWWYDFKDDGNDPSQREQNFGIVRNNLTPKPAYQQLQQSAKGASRPSSRRTSERQ